ncbi:MAG: hypothetical protein ACLUEK_02385 [Oscillospiraceae bacterium]
MLDLLEHYIYDSLPREDFATSPGLRRKVGPEGELLPFMAARRSLVAGAARRVPAAGAAIFAAATVAAAGAGTSRRCTTS